MQLVVNLVAAAEWWWLTSRVVVVDETMMMLVVGWLDSTSGMLFVDIVAGGRGPC